MPAQVQKSFLAGKLPQGALVKSANAVQGNLPAVGGNQGLPAGIEHGVAKLVLLQLGQFKADAKKYANQPYWQAQGIVVSPEYHNGVKIAGDRTRIQPQALCDTPDRQGEKSRKTLQEHVGWFYAHLEALGLDTKQLVGQTDQEVETKIMQGMAALVQQGVHFKFRTWSGSKSDVFAGADGKWRLHNVNKDGSKGAQIGTKFWPNEQAARADNPYAGKEPLVNEQWGAAVEWHPTEESANGAMIDGTGGSTIPAVEAQFNEFPEATEGGAGTEEVATAVEMTDETPDIATLVAAADGGDEASMTWLRDAAIAAGHDEATVDGAENWAAVAAMLEGSGTEETAAEDPPPPAEPEKGQVWLYLQHDAKGVPVKDLKTKQPKKPFQVEVMAVNKVNKTAQCRHNGDKKTMYPAVPFDHLSAIE